MFKNSFTIFLLLFAISVFLSCTNNAAKETPGAKGSAHVFENELFSLAYPANYSLKTVPTESDFSIIQIENDSLSGDCIMRITWEAPNTFPAGVKEFVYVFTHNEIQEFKESNNFYDILTEDSIYTIDNHPTYSITSVFAENADTIIQSRIGLIIPGKCDVMIVQQVNTKITEEQVKTLADILKTMKFK